MSNPDWVTAQQIHEARPDVPLATIANQMLRGAPWFPGATLVGRTRVVPLAEAEHYCATYIRYARRRGGPLSPAPHPPSQKATQSEE